MSFCSHSISQSKSHATPMFNSVGGVILLEEEEVSNYEQLYKLPQMPLDLAIGKALVTFEEFNRRVG